MKASIAKWGGAAAALAGASCLLWYSQRKPTPSSAPSTPRVSSSSSTGGQRENRELIYDCKPFGVEPAPACAQLPAPERDLLEAADFFGVRKNDCHFAVTPVERERAEQALQAISKLGEPPPSPLRRALLQNAALRLQACSRSAGSKPGALLRGNQTGGTARAWSLTPEELSALPRAEEQLRPWLGDPGGWLRAEQPATHLHESSTGGSLSYQALASSGDVANVARAVLLDANGHVLVSDVIVRALFRRTAERAVYFCVAELDPSSQECGAARTLRPVAAQTAARAFKGEGAPGCPTCHFAGTRHSGTFGPTLGVQASAGAQARAQAALGPLLGL